MSGTSMASPAVTGSIALLFAAAAASNKSLTIDQLRTIITKKGRLRHLKKHGTHVLGLVASLCPTL